MEASIGALSQGQELYHSAPTRATLCSVCFYTSLHYYIELIYGMYGLLSKVQLPSPLDPEPGSEPGEKSVSNQAFLPLSTHHECVMAPLLKEFFKLTSPMGLGFRSLKIHIKRQINSRCLNSITKQRYNKPRQYSPLTKQTNKKPSQSLGVEEMAQLLKSTCPFSQTI